MNITILKRVAFVLLQVLLIFLVLNYFQVDEIVLGSSKSAKVRSRLHRTRFKRGGKSNSPSHGADAVCSMEIVETVPEVLRLKGYAKPTSVYHQSIQKAWLKLIELAKTDFSIVSQWGIGRKGRGVNFYNHLKEAINEKNINVDIVHTYKFKKSSGHAPNDLIKSSPQGKVRARQPDISGKTSPPWKYGIIHSKILVSDNDHFYMGSANIGSRGQSWTKEIGMLVMDCPKLASDAKKIFELYWSIDGLDKLPKKYAKELSTRYNAKNPLKVLNKIDNIVYKVFLGSSPKTLCADGRSDDLEAILHIIQNANEFIHIAVNEYIPMDLWKKREPWNVIDEALKEAVGKRKVSLKFLVNSRASHKNLMMKHLKILKSFKPDQIEIKVYQADLRGFQGSHNKLLVTEKAALIGTSNWTEDYFTTTAGVTFVIEPYKKSGKKIDLRQQLDEVFMRDFTSTLAQTMPD